MNRMLIVCGLVGFMAAGSMSYPNGAPPQVCNDPSMSPTFHANVCHAIGVNNTNLYTLSSQPVAGNSGLVQVTLSGPPFMGFVVRATTPGETNLGQFIVDENSISFNNIDCANPSDMAVTHVGSTIKHSINLLWQDNNKGNSIFQATTVQDIRNYVVNIF